MQICYSSKREIEIDFNHGQLLIISAERDVNANTLLDCDKQDSLEHGEESIQLLEGCSYEYELPDDCTLEAISNIVTPSRRNACRGRITPGIYVGRLALLVKKEGKAFCEVAVEVRSIKANYRDEYRTMLEDITTECTELLMQHSSAVTQRYSVDYSNNSTTLYQRFAFVKSVVDSAEFRNAVHRVMSMPVTAWMDKTEELDIRRSRRFGSSQIRQIASRGNRIKLVDSHPLASRLQSVPLRLSMVTKTDTVDTPENRFVKHALKEFERFCGFICQQLEDKNKSSKKLPAIYYEAKALETRFSEYLSHSLFRDIQAASSLCLNSPVLQRKSGYREILRAWLMYDLAAKLVWKALDDDAYHIGKRDVATLYEYWVFFKLLRLIEDIFDVDAKETKALIKKTSDGLGLQLLSGKHTAIKGSHKHKGREFTVQLNFNRFFGSSDYPKAGSWTQPMRPDYTLSLWPKAFSEEQAEEQELIVHVHFDAKYKVEGLHYLTSLDDVSVNSEALSLEKEMQKKGVYKRADLLKMHAYKDAIRRTVGAYVLYPGTETYNRQGFHEIVPGLGAFPLSPSETGDGLKAIRDFINEVVQHFSNRASQRERLSYHQYDIHKGGSAQSKVLEVMPEYAVNSVGLRPVPPSESTVLVAYYRSAGQYRWIKKNGLYNIRLDDKGLKIYGAKEAGARYLLLRTGQNTETADIWQIVSDAPKILSKADLKKRGYPVSPTSRCKYYLVYTIKPIDKKEFGCVTWDVKSLKEYSNDYRPFAISLSALSKVIRY